MNGIQRIEAERRRQEDAECWDAEHDDEHEDGSLADAALCYELGSDQGWPWDREWWKPSPGDRVRDLEKAGALYLAEHDRLERAGAAPMARLMKRKAVEMGKRIDALLRNQ